MSDLMKTLEMLWPVVAQNAQQAGFPAPALVLRQIGHEAPPVTQDLEEEALTAVEAGYGWMRFRSAAWDGKGRAPDPSLRGELIWAEWRDPVREARSVRISPADAGSGLRCDVFEEAPGGAPVLCESVALRGRHPRRHPLWEVCWGASEDKPYAVRRLFSRFRGYTSEVSS